MWKFAMVSEFPQCCDLRKYSLNGHSCQHSSTGGGESLHECDAQIPRLSCPHKKKSTINIICCVSQNLKTHQRRAQTRNNKTCWEECNVHKRVAISVALLCCFFIQNSHGYISHNSQRCTPSMIYTRFWLNVKAWVGGTLCVWIHYTFQTWN